MPIPQSLPAAPLLVHCERGSGNHAALPPPVPPRPPHTALRPPSTAAGSLQHQSKLGQPAVAPPDATAQQQRLAQPDLAWLPSAPHHHCCPAGALYLRMPPPHQRWMGQALGCATSGAHAASPSRTGSMKVPRQPCQCPAHWPAHMQQQMRRSCHGAAWLQRATGAAGANRTTQRTALPALRRRLASTPSQPADFPGSKAGRCKP